MKTIQVEVDDALLEAMSKYKEWQAIDTSEFLLRSAKFLIKLREEHEIDAQIERAYSDPRVRDEFDREMKEWEDEQVWID
ncbi:hypothetical protein HUU40_20555 [candidate division KSB1 bacterium]|nr:hypothetical protein [candidate division KSB1 bacterium]